MCELSGTGSGNVVRMGGTNGWPNKAELVKATWRDGADEYQSGVDGAAGKTSRQAPNGAQ